MVIETQVTKTLIAPKNRARFNSLMVESVRPLTADSVEVTFAVPEALHGQYNYAPGQYLALRSTLNGRELRRSYSICRPPTVGSVSVAIKRDLGGVFSTWANSELLAGMAMDVMTPQGTFTTGLDDLDNRRIVGIAAGSGITPLMSLARTVLEKSSTSHFVLVYTNRTALDVMFLDELADLKDKFPARFELYHVLSRQQRSSPLLSGRIDEEKLRLMFATIIRPSTVDEWFLCGPFELVQLCRDTLADVHVPASDIRFELFSTGEPYKPEDGNQRPVVVLSGDKTFEINFTLDGESATVTTPVNANESILTAALRVRPDVPFACAGGVCGTCRARVVSGDVKMTENYALEPDELARGYVLTCQSHPVSDTVVVDYDV
ncbi:phenylacetate-CoA oxygenase/reductase subunit PaaK [Alpinimonas psychrophila]|uniref:Ring-1,2-phenylacetyl-CoA epoxidase subunit PaaE n=1 Tax=Alpinimonas psychrophila TaxID=748908 RepID=A0A7W3JU95_9MICO|nr:1,2-phenylacetyl-CoA epoxidase subunit PaaE [Alpinimonas psychrophila]MBA8829391.1 ring-1,2-phenylacetyl-CoA epoxidase subunit PaaE [Alpinimonas psychrophila]